MTTRPGAVVTGPLRVRVEAVMGTVASLHLRGGVPDVDGLLAAAIDAAFAHLHDIDRRFSPYRTDSEISLLGRGDLAEAQCSPDVRQVLAACERLREATAGVFDIHRHSVAWPLDPSGYVKGWAAEGAAAILVAAGARNFCLNVGGDVIARGEPEPGRGWRVGIRHPGLVDRTAAVLEVRDLAVATSGAYERGDHIRDARTGSVTRGLASVTIVGPSLVVADVNATIAFAMGIDGIAWGARQPGYDVYAITAGERATWTPGLDRLLVPARLPA